ncbi:Yip1 family protein [Psychrobacillus sp. FJAT-51614]|uniref:Yip1 family protein n=1 Tax=Psychrobacillus mangrovi TaxID=3117745 RepID=A0ABU8F3Z6_9BACI
MSQEKVNQEVEKLNPFFTIWMSTRKTVRYVLDYKELKYTLTLAAIAGISNSISGASEISKSFEISLWFLIIAIIVLGPLFGLISVGIGTVIYTVVGKWFGGFGTFKEMAKMMGIVMVPSIWLTPYWILSFIFVRNNLFIMKTGDFSAGSIIWFLISSLLTLIYSIWMVVIQSKAIGEVHQFSSWKGFATLIIPSIIFGIIVFIIMIIVIFSIFVPSY